MASLACLYLTGALTQSGIYWEEAVRKRGGCRGCSPHHRTVRWGGDRTSFAFPIGFLNLYFLPASGQMLGNAFPGHGSHKLLLLSEPLFGEEHNGAALSCLGIACG